MPPGDFRASAHRQLGERSGLTSHITMINVMTAAHLPNSSTLETSKEQKNRAGSAT